MYDGMGKSFHYQPGCPMTGSSASHHRESRDSLPLAGLPGAGNADGYHSRVVNTLPTIGTKLHDRGQAGTRRDIFAVFRAFFVPLL
jgi:hypothetical protein